MKTLTGSRIRLHRTRVGLSQTALAKRVGISTSYLNLIEHNKRGIAGKILLDIAQELGILAANLSEEADVELAATLQEAASSGSDEIDRTSIAEFAGRFPDWSKLLAGVFRQTREQESVIAELSDRMTHDPFLAESLHLMLSNITAIRSTAGILKSVDDISASQRVRFHNAIHEESKRLSDAAQALIQYFEIDTEKGARTSTPEEELELFLSSHQYRFPELDVPVASANDIDEILKAAPQMTTSARAMAETYLSTYLKDARKMPLNAFASSATAADFNPSALASEFQVSLHAVFRRMATLKREGIAAPSVGLLIVNAAGHALMRSPLPDFPLPRHGNACPLWPIYQSFSQPERPQLSNVELPDGQRFVMLAVALPRAVTTFGTPPDYRAAMLILPEDQAETYSPWISNVGSAREVGTSCRICPRANCSARSEETLF